MEGHGNGDEEGCGTEMCVGLGACRKGEGVYLWHGVNGNRLYIKLGFR